MEKKQIQLKKEERPQLIALLAKGKLGVKVFNRATALMELDRGKTLTAVAQTLGVSYPTILSWRDKYRQQGLQCLYDAPRPGRPIEIDGQQRAQITALACSDAPEGHAPLEPALVGRQGRGGWLLRQDLAYTGEGRQRNFRAGPQPEEPHAE